MTTAPISPDTRAIILLCASLQRDGGPKPLSLGEYNGFARWLKDRNLRPGDLIGAIDVVRQPDVLESGVAPDRLTALLDRGVLLALELDRWMQRGLWVVGRSDDQYPRRLRASLRHEAPPFLFGAGAVELLAKPALCVVGSRDASEDALSFTRRLGQACAKAGFGVVSGAAAGVDRTAMDATMEAGGTAVGVLAEGLTKTITSKQNRERLMEGRLCLVSTFMPDARWLVGRAMERNKYLYGLAEAAVIAESDTRGGTWTGAQENLRHKWVSAAVRADSPIPIGNRRLLANGLHSIGNGDVINGESLQFWFEKLKSHQEMHSKDLFHGAPTSFIAQAVISSHAGTEAPTGAMPNVEPESAVLSDTTKVQEKPNKDPQPTRALYDVFLRMLATLIEAGPRSERQVAADLEILPTQARAWLNRAVEEGIVAVKGKSKKYELVERRLL